MVLVPRAASLSEATSLARSPRRARIVRMAKSRRPAAVRRSQLASRRLTCPGSSARDLPLSRQGIARGTASASETRA